MIVISNMLGTLTTGSPVIGLVDRVRHNQSKLQARLYIASITPAYVLAKAGLIDWQQWGQSLMVKSLSMVKDATPEKMKLVGEWAVEHDLWKKRRADVVSRLIEHKQRGAQVYIASSVVEPFANRIGAQTIGTPVEYENGRVRVAGDLAAQVAHVNFYLEVLEAYVLNKDLGDVDWGDIWRRVGKVSPEEWTAYKDQLTQTYRRIWTMLQDLDAWDDERPVGGALAMVVHTAYHLGEVRQAMCMVKQP